MQRLAKIEDVKTENVTILVWGNNFLFSLDHFLQENFEMACLCIKPQWAHVRVEDLDKDAPQLRQVVPGDLDVDGFHPVRHDFVPHLKGDDVVGDQAKEPHQTLLDVVNPEEGTHVHFRIYAW